MDPGVCSHTPQGGGSCATTTRPPYVGGNSRGRCYRCRSAASFLPYIVIVSSIVVVSFAPLQTWLILLYSRFYQYLYAFRIAQISTPSLRSSYLNPLGQDQPPGAQPNLATCSRNSVRLVTKQTNGSPPHPPLSCILSSFITRASKLQERSRLYILAAQILSYQTYSRWASITLSRRLWRVSRPRSLGAT